ALGTGLGVTLLGAVVAALLTARRVLRRRDGSRAPRRRRHVAAGLFLLAGLSCATVTATVMQGRGADAMQTAGQASIWFAIGLALLGPVLLRAVVTALAALLRVTAGRRGAPNGTGDLAVTNVRQRAGQVAAGLMPVILFTGISTATLSMQRVENRALAAEGAVKDDVVKNVETLNYVVVGMIAVFAAIMLVNTLVAATTYRRREFGQQRLAGATPGQVLAMVGVEGAVLAVTGVLAGVAASLVTLVPYGIARTGSAVPDVSAWIYGGVLAVAVLLTFTASLGAAGRTLRVPAVAAVGH
ncbi:ABC transporter permease, partial [Micromonospora phytophila]|uniref:FtsX-like permease family protein n=1 Tax=Micromonospora phytophila TaxID=709888 RepID=UPI00202EF89E